MTVRENVGFGLKVRPSATRPSKAEIRARAEELLNLVQLPGLEKRYPAQLSGGQRQRVALARAMAIEPKVLLLDEPFGALDAQVRRELRSWLREIHNKTGHTTVFVTHDQEEALELADRVVVMNKGQVEQVGTPDDIYDHPASPFVFGFIGESSKLPVTVGGGQVRYRGAQIDTAPEDMPAGEGVMYFRPYDIELVEGSSAAIEGKVIGRRRTAGTRHIELELTGGDRMEIELAPERPTPQGSTLMFRPKKWIIFPAAQNGKGS
jgi:sulfate/thiosulfate transport system ATP-binding protein